MRAPRLVQVIVLVTDLDDARQEMENLGFRVAAGGRHPGRGTANLIVPFGDAYLELLAVLDRAEAAASPQGRPVLDALGVRGPGPARWSLETDDIEGVGHRVGLEVESRRRVRPDGETVAWRAVGVDLAWREPWRPAFMAWERADLHPARLDGPHPNGATGFASVVVGLPAPEPLTAWLAGPPPASVELVPTAPDGPQRVTVTTADGEVTLPTPS
jgi:hypothetical protein